MESWEWKLFSETILVWHSEDGAKLQCPQGGMREGGKGAQYNLRDVTQWLSAITCKSHVWARRVRKEREKKKGKGHSRN